ncbi:hypothetical protein [Nonomuraea sp. NPDC049750]
MAATFLSIVRLLTFVFRRSVNSRLFVISKTTIATDIGDVNRRDS